MEREEMSEEDYKEIAEAMSKFGLTKEESKGVVDVMAKTDMYYLEMIVFGSINPIIVMPTIVFTENAYITIIVGTVVGCLQYLWMRRMINKKRKP